MICVSLNGGLGNQMFQYAVGRYLAIKLDATLVFDTSTYQNIKYRKTRRTLALNVFDVKINEASHEQLILLKPKCYKFLNAVKMNLNLGGLQTTKYFIENGFEYNVNIEKVSNNCYLVGYWQSYRYFNVIETVIRSDFQFKQPIIGNNEILMGKIRESNSVGVHVRRGDYVKNSFHGLHGALGLDYYQRAIEYIKEIIKDPTYFIFSDDPDWTKSNLIIDSPCYYVSDNVGDKSYIDMQLMVSCKHLIIANSSFSWWAAWLNDRPSSIIIAPENWFNAEELNSRTVDLLPKNWIKL